MIKIDGDSITMIGDYKTITEESVRLMAELLEYVYREKLKEEEHEC